MKKKKLLTLFGFLVSIVLLYFALKDLHFREIAAVLKTARYGYTPLLVASIACSVILSSYRWSRVAGTGVTVNATFTALIIGLFVNNVLPARLGEIARAYVLQKKSRTSFTYALSTVALERVFDLSGLVVLLLLFLPKHVLPETISRAIMVVTIAFAVSIIGLFVFARPGFANLISTKLASIHKPFIRKIGDRVQEILINIRRINRPGTLVFFVFLSALIWFFMSIGLYLALKMFDVAIDVATIPFVCALLNLGLVVPSSPGYVGVYQFILVYLLALFGVPKTEGFAVSIVFHASWYLPYNITGFILLAREQLHMKNFIAAKEDSDRHQ